MASRTLIVLIFGISAVLATDYCKPDICWNGPHPGCRNPGRFGPECNSDVELLDMRRYQGLLLKEHNRLRELTASGRLSGFPPAAAMPELRWDDELSHVAEFNAKTCQFHHDCANTDRFPAAGQNIFWNYEVDGSIEATIKFMVQNWFDEYKQSSRDVISGRRDPGMDGHFLGIVGDQNTHIGCAATRHTDRKYKSKYIYLVCNLSNYEVKPVYKEGRPGSKCQRRSRAFPSLCA